MGEWKESYKESAETCVGRRGRKVKNPWISSQAVDLMDQRRKLKPLRQKSNEHLDKYKQVSSTLQRQLRLDKEKWIQDKCSEAEEGL